MSSTTVPENNIPRSIEQKLGRLRSAIRQFLVVDGLGKVLGALLIMLLLDVAFDRLFRMDFAQRAIMLAVIGSATLAVAWFRLFKPLSKKVTDDALILQVEEKYDQLKQSLISAAQFSRGSGFEEQGYSQTMVDATIRHGSQLAEGVQFGKTVDGTALIRNAALLLVAVTGLVAIGVGVANTDFWKTWFNRNVLLTNDQWPRNTMLEIDGVTNGSITLLRGEDHKQIVRVLPESRIKDVEVSIEFDDGPRRTTQKMRKTGEKEHMLVFANVASPIRFRAIGGDDTTDWVQVNLVDAPGWDELEMTVDMPDYTGIPDYPLPAGGGPHTLLEGSALSIRGMANKPLAVASIKRGQETWSMVSNDQSQWRLDLPADQLAGGKYTFDLADQRDLRSGRPTTFSIKIKPDRVPTIGARLSGNSGKVVPRARVPISYTANDEFAITAMRLEHSWVGDSADSVRQQAAIDLTTLSPKLAERLGARKIDSRVTFELESLQLPVGVSLRLLLAADDNNTLSGPGIGRSREFLLRVVSEEELRADLLRREIEQRKAFELVLTNQEKLTFDLQAVADQMDEASLPRPSEVSDNLRDIERRQKLVGTNITTIASRFGGFLEEAINNRLDEAENKIQQSQSIEERFSERIIKPIRQLDEGEVSHAAVLVQIANRNTNADQIDAGKMKREIAQAIAKQNEVIQEMQTILSAMKDSETYQEVVNKAIEIKRMEEGIRDKTRERKNQDGGGDIFDDVDGSDGLFDDEEMSKDRTQKKEKDGDDG